MKCPGCQTTLKAYRPGSDVVDVCPACRGMWFDKGELQVYLRDLLKSHREIPHARAELFRKAVAAKQVDEGTRVCPRCGEEMGKLNYGYDSNIILDRCPACEGVWVEAEEVMRLAVFTKGNPKMDRLAASLAEHTQEELDRREFDRSMAGLGRSGGLLAFGPKIIMPLYDDQERRTVPVVTLALIVMNVLAFGFCTLGEIDRQTIFAACGAVPQRIFAGHHLWTLFTYMFLHAGFFHLLGNMFFLWIFGDNVEDAFGHLGYALSYVVAGLCAALLQAVASPDSAVPCVGASGAVSGVMGAYFLLYPHANVHTFVISTVVKIPAVLYIGCWFGFQLLFALLSARAGAGGHVAWFAHVGGFVAGAVLALPWKGRAASGTGTGTRR